MPGGCDACLAGPSATALGSRGVHIRKALRSAAALSSSRGSRCCCAAQTRACASARNRLERATKSRGGQRAAREGLDFFANPYMESVGGERHCGHALGLKHPAESRTGGWLRARQLGPTSASPCGPCSRKAASASEGGAQVCARNGFTNNNNSRATPFARSRRWELTRLRVLLSRRTTH